jgi:hypothetical protein
LIGIVLCVVWRRRGDVEVDAVVGGELPGPAADSRRIQAIDTTEAADAVDSV